MDTYQLEANEFMVKNGVKMQTKYVDHAPYFDDDKQARDIWKITLTRNKKSYTFRYGQSIANSGQEPTAYDVLTCLTKYDPDTFEMFCSEYGYNVDSRNAEKLYKATVMEWKAVDRLFRDVIDQLAEIQ